MDQGCQTGGILTVLELKEDYKSAFAYDFRNRFNISYKEIGESVDFDEAFLLIKILIQDPSSWIAASIQNWAYPITHEFLASAATYDLLAHVNSKTKPKPYPRPWDVSNTKTAGSVRRDAKYLLRRAKDGDLEWQNKRTPM